MRLWEWIRDLVWNRRLKNSNGWAYVNSESLVEGVPFNQAINILKSMRDDLNSKATVIQVGLDSNFAFFDGEYKHLYSIIPVMAGSNKEGYDVTHFLQRWDQK